MFGGICCSCDMTLDLLFVRVHIMICTSGRVYAGRTFLHGMSMIEHEALLMKLTEIILDIVVSNGRGKLHIQSFQKSSYS